MGGGAWKRVRVWEGGRREGEEGKEQEFINHIKIQTKNLTLGRQEFFLFCDIRS